MSDFRSNASIPSILSGLFRRLEVFFGAVIVGEEAGKMEDVAARKAEDGMFFWWMNN